MGMPLEAEGSLSEPLQALATLIAACPRFQTVVGTPGNADAALEFIHWPLVEEADSVLPLCIVQPPTEAMARSLGIGSWSLTGNTWASFMFPAASSPHNRRYDAIKFTNDVGVIIDEMRAKRHETQPNGLQTFLAFSRDMLIDGPGEGNPAENNGLVFYGAKYAFIWG